MGMPGVIFNIEAGNYYSKATFYYDSNKRNLCSYWLFYTFGSIYVLLQNCLWVPEDFHFWVSGSRINQKCSALDLCVFVLFALFVFFVFSFIFLIHFFKFIFWILLNIKVCVYHFLCQHLAVRSVCLFQIFPSFLISLFYSMMCLPNLKKYIYFKAFCYILSSSFSSFFSHPFPFVRPTTLIHTRLKNLVMIPNLWFKKI